LPEGIEFNSQTEIDSFQTNYPNCTEIEGQVQILGNNIYNLNGLNILTIIGDDLSIAENDFLNDLSGLNNLTSIGGSLFLMGVDGINGLLGFDALMTINDNLQIGYCDSLINLTGLNSLSFVGGNIFIEINPLLSDLSGIENLTATGGGLSIYNNNNLVNLNGLQNLTSIEGHITIHENEILESLNGIKNIQSASITNLNISNNSSLSTCEVQSICDYLSDPSGTISISNNETGCNSQSEVETACENVSIEEFMSNKLFEIFPNPAKNKLTIRNNKELIIKGINIINQLGEKVYSTKTNVNIIDISKLNTGIYFVEIIAGHNNFRKKLIIN